MRIARLKSCSSASRHREIFQILFVVLASRVSNFDEKTTNLSEQSFLIIGGSSDIALHLGEIILGSGRKLTVLARDMDRLTKIKTLGADIIEGDGLDSKSVEKAIDVAAENGNGKISGAAHLIGSISLKAPHLSDLDFFHEVIQTNLSSAFLALSIFSKKMMKAGESRLVFTSSVAATLGLVNHEAISAAKAGLEGMVRSAAATYARRGLRINAVAPGLTDTRLASQFTESDVVRKMATDMIPIRKISTPSQIASTINWLLTEAPSNLTGEVIHLDGGMSRLRN